MIKLTYYKHSCFVLDFDGYKIALDPFTGVPGLKDPDITANEVLCSHEHGDHNYVQAVKLTGGSRPGDLKITEISSFHDKEGGKLRGLNTLRIFEYGGLRIMHCGDIGVIPTKEQIEVMKSLDAVMIPVGGYYTMEPAECKELLDMIKPKLIIPMHYKTADFGYAEIGTVQDFTKYYDNVVMKGRTIELTGNESGVYVLGETE